MMRHRLPFSLIFVVAALAAGATAAKPEIHTSRGGVALDGYDAVAYFAQGMPVRGDARFEHRWKGAVWRFASADHRDHFVRDPERYAPQFGGYCAYAVSRGYTASGDPLVWRIVADRLYVNYSKEAGRLWAQDIPGNIARGRRNWPGVLGR
jgi:YHS domain-containing protein